LKQRFASIDANCYIFIFNVFANETLAFYYLESISSIF
jgi:hypothetical protein